MYCDRCGRQLGDSDLYCWNCGNRLMRQSLEPAVENVRQEGPLPVHQEGPLYVKQEGSLKDPNHIFQIELESLRKAGLISDEEFAKVFNAHQVLHDIQRTRPAGAAMNVGVLSPVMIDLNQPLDTGEASWSKETATVSAIAGAKIAAAGKIVKPAKEMKIRTAQDIRDRNITWVLVIGVIFVITAGVIFATSNWSIFSSTVKTALVVLVTVLFFGISLVTEKVLKITKTAFAFWILGALFVPVAVLSAGYFQLFGPWLSLTGEGRYILGIVGATITAATLAVSTYRYSNRLFAWLTLISCSLDAVFIIAAFKPALDFFYLGIVLYNALLVLFYAQKKHPAKLQIFLNQMHAFIPVNLVISTLFMLLFFKDLRFYGLNLVLTSLIYIFMVFSRWEKEYSIVFSGMLVYGLYQIVESTPLILVEPVIFALIGCLFAGIEYFTRNRDVLRKIFTYASGLGSLLAFIYVNLKGLMIFQTQPSWIVLVSFLIIALNYFYLANRSKNRVFAWLAPVFLLAAGEQAFGLIRLGIGNYQHAAHAFIVAALLFTGLYYFNKWNYTRVVRASSGFLSLAAMAIAFLIAQAEGNRWTTVVILSGLVSSLYLVRTWESSKKLRSFLSWVIPLVLALDIFKVFDAIFPQATVALLGGDATGIIWHDRLIHFGLTVMLLFAISLVLRRFDRELARSTFRISHILIPLAVLPLAFEYFDLPLVFALTLLNYLVSLKITLIDHGKNSWLRGFLYASYAAGTLLIFSILATIEADDRFYAYVLPFCSVLLALIWWRAQAHWKRWTGWYFIPFSLIGGLILSIKSDLSWVDYPLLLLSISLILFVLHKSRFKNLTPLALLLLYPGTANFYHQVLQSDRIALLATLIFLLVALRLAGQFVYPKLFDFKDWQKHILSVEVDWYSLGSLCCTAAIDADVLAMGNPGWLRLVPPILLSALLLSQRLRVGAGVDGGVGRRVIDTVWMASLLLPFETLIELLKLPTIIDSEARLLPLLPLVIYLTRKTWTLSRKLVESLELLVLLFITAVLFKDIFVYDYFADALITGVLSLASLFVGMHFQRKTYFYVGAGALVLNGIIQTRSFWQSLPWWAYLLLAGLILIGIASYTEMRKRKR